MVWLDWLLALVREFIKNDKNMKMPTEKWSRKWVNLHLFWLWRGERSAFCHNSEVTLTSLRRTWKAMGGTWLNRSYYSTIKNESSRSRTSKELFASRIHRTWPVLQAFAFRFYSFGAIGIRLHIETMRTTLDCKIFKIHLLFHLLAGSCVRRGRFTLHSFVLFIPNVVCIDDPIRYALHMHCAHMCLLIYYSPSSSSSSCFCALKSQLGQRFSMPSQRVCSRAHVSCSVCFFFHSFS